MKPVELKMRLICLVVLVQIISGGVIELVAEGLQAGAAKVDVTPVELPVIRNGGFLQAVDDKVLDPLYARSLVLRNEDERLAIVLVDSCMIPLDVCDSAKRIAQQRTGIRMDRILIAATHNHSSPSVMDYCLGTSADPRYVRYLPLKIAESIEHAASRVEPAEIGWGRVDAGEYTKNRRWIYHRSRPLTDPFGEASVLANMHPGHNNPDVAGPSGPTDPWLTFLSVRKISGEPLALIGNFSMHYFSGHNGISSDYFGRFAEGIGERTAPGDQGFTGMMSQGTSGDLWWGDYSLPQRQSWSIDEYTGKLLDLVEDELSRTDHFRDVPIGMAESRMVIGRRLPTAERLEWAEKLIENMNGAQPANRPEVYAQQAKYINENPEEKIVLQALRIGDFGIAAWPNEVYAISGLKLKYSNPLGMMMNIELANGASGYIPPVEQHALGGYTTWPSRTAGLHESAESRIVDELKRLLENVSGMPSKAYSEPPNSLSQALMAGEPDALWRMGQPTGGDVSDSSGRASGTRLVAEGLYALHVTGLENSAGHNKEASRAMHLVDASLKPDSPIDAEEITLEFCLWPSFEQRDSREEIISTSHGSVFLNEKNEIQIGDVTGKVPARAWTLIAVVISKRDISVYINGKRMSRMRHGLVSRIKGIRIAHGFQGKIDEVALFKRALNETEVARHWLGSGLRNEDEPLDADLGLKSILVPDGFRVELVASEPQTIDPVAFDWDRHGRLWTVEMTDYPYGVGENGEPGGRVRILTDEDGDGHFEQSKIFVERLNFPNGIITWRNGVIITAAPEILYLEDRDGDGRADFREVLVTGLTEGNQQLRANGLRWSLDNRLHIASGGHHSNYGINNRIRSVRMGNQEVIIGSRDFSLAPDSGSITVLSGPSQFGRNRDDWGNWFGTQNSRPLWHYVFPDYYIGRNPTQNIADGRVQLPGPINPPLFQASRQQKRYHSFEQGGHFTSACGGMIYRGDRMFPGDEIHAFSCDPFHNIVQHLRLEDDGVSFRAERVPHSMDVALDFFASVDRWSRPVMVRNGPDGALYIADMYRYMIEHPDWLPEEGRNELKAQYRAGDQLGRIYRIVPDRKVDNNNIFKKLSSSDPADLAECLGNPSGWVRDMAHKLLVNGEFENGTEEVVSEVRKYITPGNTPRARVHALWILDHYDAVSTKDITDAIMATHSGVIISGLKLSERHYSQEISEAAMKAAQNPDGKVQLQLAFSSGEWPQNSGAGSLLYQIYKKNLNDSTIRTAIISSIIPHLSEFLEISGGDLDPAMALAFSRSSGSGREGERIRERLLASVLERSIQQPDAELLRISGEMLKAHRTSPGALPPELQLLKNQIVEKSVALVQNREHAPGIRLAASRLVQNEVSDESLGDIYIAMMEIVRENPVSDSSKEALNLLSQSGTESEGAIGELLEISLTLSPSEQMRFLGQLTGNPTWARAMIGEAKSGTYPVSIVRAAGPALLERHPDPEVKSAFQSLFEISGSKSKTDIIAQYSQVLDGQVDRKKGRQTFLQHCSRCHTFRDEGVEIGPSLESVGNHEKVRILTNIIDPNIDIQPGFHLYDGELTNGEYIQGIVTTENATSVGMKMADGSSKSVLRNSLSTFKNTGRSMMPEGFENAISPEDMANLIHYLRE